MSSIPATIHAADLAPGDRFQNPATGELVTFTGWDTDEDGPCAVVSPARRFPINLDPSQLVNLENDR